jgi:hypothetical protein
MHGKCDLPKRTLSKYLSTPIILQRSLRWINIFRKRRSYHVNNHIFWSHLQCFHASSHDVYLHTPCLGCCFDLFTLLPSHFFLLLFFVDFFLFFFFSGVLGVKWDSYFNIRCWGFWFWLRDWDWRDNFLLVFESSLL